jgi:rubrerythrin
MITKEDVLDYFNQTEKKVKEIENFYGEIFSQVKDLDLKEMFLRLKGEEKVHLELIQRLKEIFQAGWEE